MRFLLACVKQQSTSHQSTTHSFVLFQLKKKITHFVTFPQTYHKMFQKHDMVPGISHEIIPFRSFFFICISEKTKIVSLYYFYSTAFFWSLIGCN